MMLITSSLPWIFFGVGRSSAIPNSPHIASNLVTRWGLNRNPGPASPSDCINTPTSRKCWWSDFSIDTDAEEKWPSTGKIVNYEFEISEKTMAPDGFSRQMLVINGQYPGPLIEAGKYF
jgi:hypothetical protein